MNIQRLAEENQRKAGRLIVSSKIFESWKSIGAEVNLVGSLSTGLLMKHLDIDFHIYTETLDLSKSLKAVSAICGNMYVNQIEFRNLAGTDEACFEWHIVFTFEEEEWQVDMIQILKGSKFDGYFEHVASRITKSLTSETKNAILELKYLTPDSEHITGIQYYRAVISDNVRTYPEFMEWLKSHPENGIVEWCP